MDPTGFYMIYCKLGSEDKKLSAIQVTEVRNLYLSRLLTYMWCSRRLIYCSVVQTGGGYCSDSWELRVLGLWPRAAKASSGSSGWCQNTFRVLPRYP